MMPDAGVLATILLIVGLFLLALELMIPSFGMIGILAAISLLISAWAAWSAWWQDSPGMFWTYAGFWVLGIPAVLGGMLFALQNTSLGDHIVLRGPRASQNASQADERTELHSLIGQVGEASSLLTPGGMVVVDGERFHAESRGMMLEAGTKVEVIGVKSNRLVVKAASEATIAEAEQRVQAKNDSLAETLAATDAAGSDDSGILDFEIPEG